MKLWGTTILLFFVHYHYGQTDSIEVNLIDETVIEEYIESNDEEGEFQFDGIEDALSYYLKQPISLNHASKSDLISSSLFSPLQINALIKYRKRYGDLLTIFELQAVPHFSLSEIREILPYITVKGGIDDLNITFKEMLTDGQDEIFVRWGRPLQESKGFVLDTIENTTPYEGSPDLFYVRYRHQYSNRFRFGFTAEKDSGEAFFKGTNKHGFDYYSFHLYLKRYNQFLKALAIGDYTVKLGQGLVLYNGFGLGKGSSVMNIRRTALQINPYSSVGETQFYRGFGAVLGLSKHIDFTVFGSSNLRDANILTPDTLIRDEIALFSSFINSGYHRTNKENAKEKALRHHVIGGSLKYSGNNGHIAFNGVYNQFDKALLLKKKLYNQFYFQGDRLANVSVDYSFTRRNMMVFGESAISDNGGMANLLGANLSLDRHVSISGLYRDLGVRYQVIDARVFGTSSKVNNNKGMYLGIQLEPNYNFKISGYIDIFKYPWLRFGLSSPSTGYDYLFRIDYRKKRKFNAYVKLRVVHSKRNLNDKIKREKTIGNVRLYRLRFHVKNQILPRVELRNRVELSIFDDGINPIEQGFLIYQDIIWKRIMGSRFSLASRFAIFDTHGNNSRIYAYESDIQGSHYIPAYKNKGIRSYLKLSYKGIQGLTIESRYAMFWFSDPAFLSSRQNSISGNVQSEMKLQFIYRF